MYSLIIRKSVYKFINNLENSQRYFLKLEDLKFFKTNKLNLDIKSLKCKAKGFYLLDDKLVVDKVDFRGNIY